MQFEEWWNIHWFGDSNKEMAKAAYRAGLLHAAEQDEGLARMNEHIEQGHGPAYGYSAICHREAAEDL